MTDTGIKALTRNIKLKLRSLMIVSYSGLPHGQEKSGNQKKPGKTKKNDKNQVKIGVFEKSQKKLFKRHQILSV